MRKVIALGGTLAMSACNFAPAYRQPVAPISASFADHAVLTQPASGLRHATDIGWREYFADPRLKAYIAAALSNNRDLAQSVARVVQARARYRIQDAARLPQLDVQAAASRNRQPTNNPQFGGIGAGSPNVPDAFVFDQFSTGVQVPSFELDFWGRVRNLSESQRQQYLATVEGERAFRLSLIGQVAAAYIQILAGQEQIALAAATVENRRTAAAAAKRRLDAGVTSTIDYRQAALLVSDAETELSELRRTTAQTENLLTILVGGPPEQNPPKGLSLFDQGAGPRIEPGLPSSLLVHRPDILQAERQLRAANADVGAARAAFLPSLSLTGVAGFISPALSNLLSAGSRQYQGTASALFPLFDGGRRKEQLTMTRARADELVAAYQRAAQEAFREVADSLVVRERYAEQIAITVSAVEMQRQLARTARRRYDNGIAIYLEVADAQRNQFAAEQKLVQLRSASLQNGVSLYIALGGGTSERSEN